MKIISRKEAIAIGVSRYFTGDPCKNGHLAEKTVSEFACVECRRASVRRYEKNHPGFKEKNDAGYRSKNRKILTEKSCAYAKANKEGMNKRNTKWREINREFFNSLISDWKSRNVDKTRVYTRNRRAKIKGSDGTHTTLDIELIFNSQGGECAYCKVTLSEIHVDHKTPISRGGSNWPDNLQITCPTCNMQKGAMTHDEFVLKIDEKLNAKPVALSIVREAAE